MEAADDGLQYVAVLSRFQAETMLLHAPDGAFLLRRSSPYSKTLHLSYCRRVQRVMVDVERPQNRFEVIHEMICREQDGYVCKSERGVQPSLGEAIPSSVRVHCGSTRSPALWTEVVSGE